MENENKFAVFFVSWWRRLSSVFDRWCRHKKKQYFSV